MQQHKLMDFFFPITVLNRIAITKKKKKRTKTYTFLTKS